MGNASNKPLHSLCTDMLYRPGQEASQGMRGETPSCDEILRSVVASFRNTFVRFLSGSSRYLRSPIHMRLPGFEIVNRSIDV
jgi:hypothetical protein